MYFSMTISSGPPETLGVGICVPGGLYCKEGVWGNDFDGGAFVPDLCLGEVTPLSEDICNGEDTNCDGIIEKELDPTDILFIVDLSGSMIDMCGHISSECISRVRL